MEVSSHGAYSGNDAEIGEQDVAVIDGAGNWTCVHCTFINFSEIMSCEICEKSRHPPFGGASSSSRSTNTNTSSSSGSSPFALSSLGLVMVSRPALELPPYWTVQDWRDGSGVRLFPVDVESAEYRYVLLEYDCARADASRSDRALPFSQMYATVKSS